VNDMPSCHLIKDRTEVLLAWAEQVERDSPDEEVAGERLSRRLGAHYVDGAAEIGFWVPELSERRVYADDVYLVVFSPLEPLSLAARKKTVRFRRERIQLRQQGDFLWGVVAGMQPGHRDELGSLYWLRYQDGRGNWHTVRDHLAYSLPFGIFAPAEFYDVARLDRERADRDYFAAIDGALKEDDLPRQDPPGNILQIHVPTATAGGTLASLTRLYRKIADKIRNGQTLLPHEENFTGYDAVQLLPIEPTIEYEAGPPFWEMVEDDPTAPTVEVILRRPDQTNWGYDIVISGSAAVNPVLLESDRPDELVDFAATLHNFPDKPIRLIFDVVFGHADNQALTLLNRHFFTGPNMYGQDMNYRHPMTRATLLEMQRRKVDLGGADGVRVDGAQDFKWWDAENQELHHADEYLRAMAYSPQEVAGKQYYPWFIFEDGRPWPQDDWELSSTYRAVTEQMPHVFQWGPLTFAHNTPFLYTFWVSKWWRIQEILSEGSNWISGCANHDTLRRGTQVDPKMRINSRLGETLLEIIDKAYDNPSTSLLTYGMFPGVPMDFVNATMRASWGFIRNVDDRYGVKVVAEESISLHWQVDEAAFQTASNFPRLKELGFDDLDELKRFMRMLDTAVVVTEYDLDAIVRLMRTVEPPLPGPSLSVETLKAIARAWMDDMHDYCNVSYYEELLNPAQVHFNRVLRQFRLERPWLQNNLRDGDVFERRRPTRGSVVFYGLRHSPDGNEQIFFMANMEGQPVTLSPLDLPLPNLPREGWQAALTSPGLELDDPMAPVTLHDSDGLLLTRRP